jgi:pimeloyl-ACP methyl ester carboxylesterase
VHHGFSVAYEAVRARVRNILTALAERGQRLDSVHVTGHSMGAALATLCALDLVTSPPRGISCERTLVCACTFGSPRVGNAAFATLFGAMVPCSVRVKTPYDVVPSLPPESVFAQKYVHVKGGVVILRDGNCAACSDEEEGEDDCVQHLTDPNWVDSLRAARLVDEQATRRNPGVLNTLASLAYRTVMGGSVIDHLPAMYYFNLQRVVWRALRDKARATVVGNG